MSESTDSPNNHPTSSASEREKTIMFKLETEEDLERKRKQDSRESVRRLLDFLQEEEEDMEPYLLPPKTLLRYALVMDIVQPSSRRSVCFTKGCVALVHTHTHFCFCKHFIGFHCFYAVQTVFSIAITPPYH